MMRQSSGDWSVSLGFLRDEAFAPFNPGIMCSGSLMLMKWIQWTFGNERRAFLSRVLYMIVCKLVCLFEMFVVVFCCLHE